jgi:uncharacterized protein
MATRLMVCDVPNLDASLGDFLGRRPRFEDRPRWEVLREWFVFRGQGNGEPVAAAFLNVTAAPGRAQGFVAFLLSAGYRVWGRPKVGNSDIDEDMLACIDEVRSHGDLTELTIVSCDSRRFLAPAQTYVDEGISVTVAGFAENSGGLPFASSIEFVDLEEVQGLFPRPIPGRVRFDHLPASGGWFEPRGEISITERVTAGTSA